MPREPDLPLTTPSASAVSPEAQLEVAYADTRADELSFALDLPVQPALRALGLELAGVALDLRILGYSHQVVVTTGGEPLLTETVARLSGPGCRSTVAALPDRHEAYRDAGPAGMLRYSISTSVSPLGDDRDDVESLILELDRAERAVLGVFPGHRHAFTGLLAGEAPPGCVEWRSWHAYPGTGEMVQTRSRLERDPA
jgi:hypothetical protein